jgi:tetratricopeptide (TPR) repeat protein
MKRAAALLLALCAVSAAGQGRLASDFEIAQMEKQLARSNDFEAQFSARLNLGDARMTRNEKTLALAEYERAFAVAENERVEARRESQLERYARASAFSATVRARLTQGAAAFTLLEEALRYAPDDPYVWNTYASAMRILGHPRKAVASGRNAVAISAKKEKKLDLAVFQYSLATSLLDADEEDEGEQILLGIVELLRSEELEGLRRDVTRSESFEVHSFIRGDVAAYVSLLNRTQLHLGALYFEQGRLDAARAQYERVLEARSDDVTALAALASMARSDAERERYFAEAFDANPFSMALVREYQRHEHPPITDFSTTGGRMRQALAQGQSRAARATLDTLIAQFPKNDTLKTLRAEAEGTTQIELPSASPRAEELRALLIGFERLTAEQRAALDQATYTSTVQFTGTAFEAGTIDNVPFRFSEPTVFEGTFDITRPLRLTYRILGVTRSGDQDALLLEPVRLEAPR